MAFGTILVILNNMLIGYARVSTHEQKLSLQLDALKKAGCEEIFTDKVSGAKETRPGLEKAFDTLQEGDTLVVWKLDRLGRSVKHLIEIVNQLNDNGINFKSLQESLDTTSSTGKLIFNIFASLAEFEKDLILERTQAGLKAARARGKLGGRPKKMNDEKLELAVKMMKDITIPVRDVCDTLNISKSTLYRYLRSKEAMKLKSKIDKKQIQLDLWLRVERNSKFVRGMKKTREEIENFCLQDYKMKKSNMDSWNYILTVEYDNNDDLDEEIGHICQEMESIAESNNCWTETNFAEIGGDRTW